MKIGGFQKTSLLDYPGNISCIVWTVGCNFNCPFCYNKDIVAGDVDIFPEDDIFDYIKKRKNMLEGVVITGGEPFLQKDLDVFCEKIKKIGLLVKIDTNGTFPDGLQNLVDKKLVDYVAMDIKAPKDKYDVLSGVKTDVKKIEKSIRILQDSGVDYEFRTTFVPDLLSKKDILSIASWLKGSKRFYLQQFKHDVPLISRKFETKDSYSKDELQGTLDDIKSFFKETGIRGI